MEDDLSKILQGASAAIEHAYFLLPIAEGEPIYRERVYCYELYHQMRCLWPRTVNLVLNGEVDKKAHPLISKFKIGATKPDFLIHAPGNMKDNYAVIEVKSSNVDSRGILKDLRTLSGFVNEVGYQRAIYWIYGEEAEPVALEIEAVVKASGFRNIEVWVHTAAGNPAYIVTPR